MPRTATLHYAKLWWAIAILMIVSIVILSLVRLPPLPVEAPRHFDKWEHLSAYLLMSGYLGQLIPRFSTHAKAAMALIAMGGILEYLQSLTGYRSLDIADFCANSLGVLIGVIVCRSKMGLCLQRFDQWLAR